LYHLSFLRKMQLVQVVSSNGRHGVYAYGTAPSAPKVTGLVQAAIYQALGQRREGCTREELKQILSAVPNRSRNDGLAQLLKRGVVREESTPSGTRLSL